MGQVTGAPHPPRPPIPLRIASIRLVATIRSSPDAVLLQGYDGSRGRPVVILCLPRTSLDVARQAQARTIFHRNIASILDVIDDAAGCCVVLDAEVGDLCQEPPCPALPIEKAVDIVLQTIEGRLAARGKGHPKWAVTPSSVFVQDDGQVRLLDGALAARLRGVQQPPRSMPSDVESIGNLLGILLTGRAEIRGVKSIPGLKRLLTTWRRVVGTTADALPGPLEEIVSRAGGGRPPAFRDALHLSAELREFERDWRLALDREIDEVRSQWQSLLAVVEECAQIGATLGLRMPRPTEHVTCRQLEAMHPVLTDWARQKPTSGRALKPDDAVRLTEDLRAARAVIDDQRSRLQSLAHLLRDMTASSREPSEAILQRLADAATQLPGCALLVDAYGAALHQSAERAASRSVAERIVKDARQLMAQGNFRTAALVLHGVPGDAPNSEEAHALQRQARALHVERCAAPRQRLDRSKHEIRAAFAASDLIRARTALDGALASGVADDELGQLSADLSRRELNALAGAFEASRHSRALQQIEALMAQGRRADALRLIRLWLTVRPDDRSLLDLRRTLGDPA